MPRREWTRRTLGSPFFSVSASPEPIPYQRTRPPREKWIVQRMRKNLAVLAPLFASVAAIPASAQQAGRRLFHVTHDTYGCVNPLATLAITNPDDPRQRDPGWVAFVIADGHCAPITPRSPWRVESVQGDLAYMTYAGTTGLPGSFYLRLSDLVELTPPPDSAPTPSPAPQLPAAINQPMTTYTPPPVNPALGAVLEPQSDWVTPGSAQPPANYASSRGYINPPGTAPPPAVPRTVQTPSKPVTRLQEPPLLVREQPHVVQQSASPMYVSVEGEGWTPRGRSIGSLRRARLRLQVDACNVGWQAGQQQATA